MPEALTINVQPRIHAEPARRERRAEEGIVSAARRGDRAAFARLHEMYAPMVHGILLARVGAREADDLTQEVFLHAMRRLITLRDTGAFGPWLATIARRCASRHHRRGRRAIDLPDDLAGDDREAPDNLVRFEAQRVLGVIRELPEAYRETLILRLVEGLTGPQIARCTGLTPGSVRVNLHRGMKLLRRELGLDEPAENTS